MITILPHAAPWLVKGPKGAPVNSSLVLVYPVHRKLSFPDFNLFKGHSLRSNSGSKDSSENLGVFAQKYDFEQSVTWE